MSQTLHLYLPAGGTEEHSRYGCLADIIQNLARFKTTRIACPERLELYFSCVDFMCFISRVLKSVSEGVGYISGIT